MIEWTVYERAGDDTSQSAEGARVQTEANEIQVKKYFKAFYCP